MPSKMRRLQSSSDQNYSTRNENIFFSNFALPINDDFDTMKVNSFFKINSNILLNNVFKVNFGY